MSRPIIVYVRHALRMMGYFANLVAGLFGHALNCIHGVAGEIFYLAQEAFGFALGLVGMAFRLQLIVTGYSTCDLFGFTANLINFTFYFVA